MSQLIRKHFDYIRLLITTASRTQRKALLKTITNDQLKAVVEIVVNLLNKVIPISPRDKSKLKSNRRFIRQIADRAITLKKKKDLILRQGGIIVLLLNSVQKALNQRLK